MAHFTYNDAGAHHARSARNCVARAIAIAAELPYAEVCALIRKAAARERQLIGHSHSTPCGGVAKNTIRLIMYRLGWTWVPTMAIGGGCTVHLRADELPAGRLVVSVSRHLTAVIDGVVNDTHDCSRHGTRCVYGVWHKEGELKWPR